MRVMLLVPLLLAAACSDNAAPKEEAPAKAEKLAAGQWEVVSEVASLRSVDKSPPAIDIPIGTKTSVSSCISEAEGKKPAPTLFATKGDTCEYNNIYISGGRLNASISCTRPGISGKIMTSVNGTYTADTFDADYDVTTYLTSDGDVNITGKMTGRRAGTCAAEPAK